MSNSTLYISAASTATWFMKVYFISVEFVCVWFQVFLGEVNAGLSTTQVMVKELKASASIQEHTQFLEEALPYRSKPIVITLSLSSLFSTFNLILIYSYVLL